MNNTIEITTTFKLVRKSSTNEWIVRRYINGKLDADSDYFTDDKQDALATLAELQSGYHRIANEEADAIHAARHARFAREFAEDAKATGYLFGRDGI